MLEIIRRPVRANPIQEALNWFEHDPFFRSSMGSWDPDEGNLAVDVCEDNNEIVVRASLPGFKKDDIDVQVHNGVLTVKAEHTEETESKNEKYYRRERRIGSISRRVALPTMIEDARAKADLKDGVLTIRIPRSDADKPKSVKIS